MDTDDRAETYRAEIRETLQAMSPQALAYQDTIVRGGIDREELDRELARRARPTASERIRAARELAAIPVPTESLRTLATDTLADLAERTERYIKQNAEQFPETAAHQRRAAREYRAELQRRDDDARAIEEGDEQRDYAEERYNAGLLRDGESDERRPEPTTPDGATAHDLARELLEQPGNSWRLTPRVRQLAQLVLASDTLEELER